MGQKEPKSQPRGFGRASFLAIVIWFFAPESAQTVTERVQGSAFLGTYVCSKVGCIIAATIAKKTVVDLFQMPGFELREQVLLSRFLTRSRVSYASRRCAPNGIDHERDGLQHPGVMTASQARRSHGLAQPAEDTHESFHSNGHALRRFLRRCPWRISQRIKLAACYGMRGFNMAIGRLEQQISPDALGDGAQCFGSAVQHSITAKPYRLLIQVGIADTFSCASRHSTHRAP
eukprot:5993126-Amphidinium_carterae.1